MARFAPEQNGTTVKPEPPTYLTNAPVPTVAITAFERRDYRWSFEEYLAAVATGFWSPKAISPSDAVVRHRSRPL